MPFPCKRAMYFASSDVWVDEPTQNGIVVYSVITPVLACLGFIGNLVSFVIMMTFSRFDSSTSTYLAVLALTSLISSAFLLVSGLCRGILWSMQGWREYEAMINIPIGGTFTCWSATAIVGVQFDRIVYLWNPCRTQRPPFCQQSVARRVMCVGLLVAILFNLPYCFMYERDCDGKLVMSDFVETTFYTVHNCLRLILFTIFPAVVLLLGNIYLIRSIKKMYKMKKQCRLGCNKKSKSKQKWMTVTLIAMIFFFLIGEIPASLVSRSFAVNLLYLGNSDKADRSKTLEIARQVATLLNGLYLAVNFFIYYLFCSVFRRCLCEMIACMKCWRRPEQSPGECGKKTRLTQVNVIFTEETSRKPIVLPMPLLKLLNKQFDKDDNNFTKK